MPVGNTPNSIQLNTMASAVAVQLRNAALAAQNLANYVNGIGTDGLAAAGFDDADAALFLELVGGIGVLSGIYFGTADLPADTDFAGLVQQLAGPA
jgi:nitroreductase